MDQGGEMLSESIYT